MAKKMAIVAVETNVLGRTAYPLKATGVEHLWKFPQDHQAEIIAAFVGDLDEGGTVKFVLRGVTSGTVQTSYAGHFEIGAA